MKLPVILVHGIGNQKKDWAEPLAAGLRKQALEEVKKIATQSDAVKEEDLFDSVAIHWADVLQERQMQLKEILNNDRNEVVISNPIGKIIHAVFGPIFRKFQNTVICEFIGDVIGYPVAQAEIHPKIDGALKDLSGSYPPGGSVPVTFIAHSLGTVITSDFIYDQIKRSPDSRFHKILLLQNLFTVGSPIALFSVRYGGPQAFQSPIHVETSDGRWINIYDQDDPVGMPLKTLNEAYQKAVFKDVRVDSGLYGESHIKYFEKGETVRIIAKKLAIDWLVHNQRIDSTEAAKLYREYDETLGIKKSPR